MNERTRDLIDYAGLLLSAVLMVVAVTGEAIGWWNDLGIALAIASLLTGLASLADLHGRRLGGLFAGAFARLDHKQDTMLDKQDAMLDKQDAALAVLGDIRRLLDQRLPPSG